MLWLQIVCPAIDYDDKCELEAVLPLVCVCVLGVIFQSCGGALTVNGTNVKALSQYLP